MTRASTIAVLVVLLFALPLKAQNFRISDQVRLLSAAHIVSPWSTWVSEIIITNESDDPVSVSIIYGAHNSTPAPVVLRDAIKLAPRQQCEFDDFLGEARSNDTRCKVIGAPLLASAFGQLVFSACVDGASCAWDHVNSDGRYDPPPTVTQNYRNISVRSRLYSYSTALGPASQTVGQNIDAVPWWAFGSADNPLTIAGIKASGVYHTNVLFVNSSDNQPVMLTVSLFDGASRGLRDQVHVRLLPFESRQQGVTDLFPKFGEWNRLNRGRAATNAYITIASEKGDSGFFAVGSLIDSRSGDPTTLESTPARALTDAQITNLYSADVASNAAPNLGAVEALNVSTHRRMEKE